MCAREDFIRFRYVGLKVLGISRYSGWNGVLSVCGAVCVRLTGKIWRLLGLIVVKDPAQNARCHFQTVGSLVIVPTVVTFLEVPHQSRLPNYRAQRPLTCFKGCFR